MKKWTVKAPAGVKSWDRLRFLANEDDPRPVIWPPLGPWWCSGYSGDFATVIAYVPHKTSRKELRKYWPEAKDIECTHEDEPIEYSDRFPKPDWWIEKESK